MHENLLLDEFLPTYDHEICISRVFRAPPDVIVEAVTNLDLFQLPLARVQLAAYRFASSMRGPGAEARRRP